MSKRWSAVAMWLAVMLASGTAFAQVADVINVQGRLVSQAGAPVPDGDYGLTLSFYKKSDDTKAAYTYVAVGVKVASGVFHVRVGSKTPLDKTAFLSGEIAWLGITVGNDAELPRLPLDKVPYAIRADSAAQASKLACTGCITKSHLDATFAATLATKAELAKVATSGAFADLSGTPTLVPVGQACGATQVVAGIGADGKVVCKNDADTTYTGANFAVSDQKCGDGFVVAGVDKSGNTICVKDKDENTTYSGKDFAVADQACAKGMVVTGVGADGKVACAADANNTYDGKNFALSQQSCPDNRVMAGISADGKVVCVLDQKGQSSGKDFALSNQTCPKGQVVSAVDPAGKVVCTLKGQVQGTPYAVSNQSCAKGLVVSGIGANGKVVCAKDANSTYSGSNFALSGSACVAGSVVTGIGKDGKPVCAKDAGLMVDSVLGWSKRVSASGKWLSSLGWGAPTFTKDASYTDASGSTTTNTANVEFTIPKGAGSAYMATVARSNGGYFDVYLRKGSTWLFHRRVNTWQAVSSASGAGSVIVQLATGLDGFDRVRIQARKGRLYFAGIGFSRALHDGEAGSGFVHWDSVAGKPSMAANAFSKSQVDNLKAAKLANGTTPWKDITGKNFALSNQSCAKGLQVVGVDASGKVVCGKDANSTYSGSNFALSNKSCSSGFVMRGVSSSGNPVCVVDKDTNSTYSGKNFALSKQSCPSGQIAKGISDTGKLVCVTDQNTKYSGTSFALSNKACPSGFVMRGVTATGTPNCVADKNSTYSGKNFALSGKSCATGYMVKGISSTGLPICAKDLKGQATGKDFALSNQACGSGQVMKGIGADGKPVCVTDQNTKSPADSMSSSQVGNLKANKLANGSTPWTSGSSHNHTYNVNDSWLRDNGDNANVKLYGNSRQMAFRTDGASEYAKGVGGYPFVWMYGGDGSGNRLAMLNTAGQLWTKNYGWLHDKFQAKGNYVPSNQSCPSGQVLRGFASNGSKICVTDKDTNSTYSGKNFALSNKSCPSGQVMRGVDSNGNPVCVADKDTNTTYSGKNFALSNKTCSSGYYVRGINSSGNPVCVKDANTTYSGSTFALSNKSCPTGYAQRGVTSSGNPSCVKMADLGVTVVRGYSNRKSSSSGWTASSGWGEPRFSTSNAYTATSSPTASGSEWMDFDIPSGTKTAYISFLQWNNGGYFDIYLRYGSTWKFHKRITNYQNVSNSGNGGTHDASTVMLAATGLNHFNQLRIQNRKGRLYFTGLGFSTADMTGAGNAGFTHWDTIAGKPTIAYTSKIPADDFTQTEVNYLRAGRLDNGTRPWIMAADDFTQTEVNNLRAGKLDNGTTPWTSGLSHNHTYNVNDSWLRDNGDNATVKLYGNSRQMVFRTDGSSQYASGVGNYPFVWMYGGDASSQRLMFVNTSGQLWTKNYGYLHDKFQAKGSYASSSHNHTGTYVRMTGDTMTGHLKIRSGGDNGAGGLMLYRNDSSTTLNERLGGIGFDSSDGNVPSDIDESSAAIIAIAAETHSTGDKGGHLTFWTSPINQNDDTKGYERMRILDNGNVAIGTTSATDKLRVNGSTRISTHLYVEGNSYLGNSYADRQYATTWRVNDSTNNWNWHSLDRYQVVLGYSSYYKQTKALNMSRIHDYCDDYDGCQVVIGMVDWWSGTRRYDMAHYSFRFHYDAGSGRWRVGNGAGGSGNDGDDGDSSEKHILNAFDACYFTEMQYIGGSQQNDGSKQLYLLYWTAYTNTTTKNKKCVITFMD